MRPRRPGPKGLLVGGIEHPDQKLLIFGTGDYARVAAQLMTDEMGIHIGAFVVDESYRDRDELLGHPVVGATTVAEHFMSDEYAFLVCVGYGDLNTRRADACERLRKLGYPLASYVSLSAAISPTATVGANTVVFEHNVVQPFVQLGNNVVLWSGNHIGHDAIIEDHCFLASHIVVSGHVRIGHHSFIGVNATLRDNISIGPRNIIGAGATMMESTAPDAVYAAERTKAHARPSSEINL